MMYARFEHTANLKQVALSFPLLHYQQKQLVLYCSRVWATTSLTNWKFCVDMCSDGAAAMMGRDSRTVTQTINRVPQNANRHTASFTAKVLQPKMSTQLNSVLNENIANPVKANAWNSRPFTARCGDMGVDYKQLLLYAVVRWISRGKVVSRVFELRNELF